MIAEKVFAEGVAKDIRNYLPPEYEDADFQVVQKNKNNGIQLIGVQVNLPERNASPIIYMEQFFDEIRQGEPVERVMNRIASCIEKSSRAPFMNSGIDLTNYDSLKEHLAIKLVNTQANRKMLQEMPHENIEDLSAIYGLVGKNGAGKTTLLRIICGLQEATFGDYSLYGISSRKHEILNARKEMGAVIETPAIYLDMSATGNLKEQYRVLGLRSFDSIPQLLKMVGLEGTGRKKAKNFSLGMRQRLGIAIALVGNPRFLVLDEPINGLDPQGIIEMRQLLLNLNQQYGITILVSSHILDELSRLATHYGFIDNGKMIKEISADDLENSFRKSIRIEVTDGKALAAVLKQTGQPYKMPAPNVAEIYHRLNISQLTSALEKYHCDLLSIQEQEENLESYYVDLIGGVSHE